MIVSAEGALRYDRTLQDLVHLLVPRVFQTELKREHEFNTSLRRISLEGGLWHNRKLNLWRNEQANDPQIRIHLINETTQADKVKHRVKMLRSIQRRFGVNISFRICVM